MKYFFIFTFSLFMISIAPLLFSKNEISVFPFNLTFSAIYIELESLAKKGYPLSSEEKQLLQSLRAQQEIANSTIRKISQKTRKYKHKPKKGRARTYYLRKKVSEKDNSIEKYYSSLGNIFLNDYDNFLKYYAERP
jgi:hypothetical protein